MVIPDGNGGGAALGLSPAVRRIAWIALDTRTVAIVLTWGAVRRVKPTPRLTRPCMANMPNIAAVARTVQSGPRRCRNAGLAALTLIAGIDRIFGNISRVDPATRLARVCVTNRPRATD